MTRPSSSRGVTFRMIGPAIDFGAACRFSDTKNTSSTLIALAPKTAPHPETSTAMRTRLRPTKRRPTTSSRHTPGLASSAGRPPGERGDPDPQDHHERHHERHRVDDQRPLHADHEQQRRRERRPDDGREAHRSTKTPATGATSSWGTATASSTPLTATGAHD